MATTKGRSALAANRPASSPNGEWWEVGSLRATAFIPDLSGADSVGNTWWERVTGGKPEDERIIHQRGVKEQRGALNGNLLAMVSQPSRADLTLEARGEESSELSELLTMGSLSGGTLEPFMRIVKSWLNECPPANRLAFGAILGWLAADAQTGYEEIQQYLPSVQLSPQNSSDFFYQINRPKESTVRPGIRINRISKWSVPLVGTVGVTVDPTASKVTASMQGWHICKLELDINTAILSDPTSGDGAYALFQELAAHGQEIAKEGDIP